MLSHELHRWIAPLGWALVHFCWQGLAVALLAWATMTLALGPSVRYAIGCAAMLAMLALPIATVAWIGAETPAIFAKTDDAPRLVDEPAPGFAFAEPRAISPAKRMAGVRERIGAATPALALTWLAGVTAVATWHVVGFALLVRLRRRATPAVDPRWIERVRVLSARLNVRRRVTLFITDRLGCPAIVGAIRPAILWPLAAMTGLTPAQVDALLAHELAHVRRHDYAINLLQTLVETLLFYHPAVWWLSRRVRQEREHCCDDLAASVVGDRATYAGALAAMETLRQPPTLALSARGGSLVERVRRLVSTPPRRPARSAGRATLCVVLLAALGLIAWTGCTHDRFSSTTRPATTRVERADRDVVAVQLLARRRRLDTPLRVEAQVDAGTIDAERDALDRQLAERARAVAADPALLATEESRRSVALLDERDAMPAQPLMSDAQRRRSAAIDVELGEIRHIGEYYLGGHVVRTGVYTIRQPVSLLRAIELAGGIDQESMRDTREPCWIVVICRTSSLAELTLRFAWADVRAHRHDDFVMLPNDQILVGVNISTTPTSASTTQASATTQASTADVPQTWNDALFTAEQKERLLTDPATQRLEASVDEADLQRRVLVDQSGPASSAVRAADFKLAAIRAQLEARRRAVIDAHSPLATIRQLQAERRQLVDALAAATRDHGEAGDETLVVRGEISQLDERIATATGLVGEYYISGAVARPGVYSVTGRKITLMQALVSAGCVAPAVPDEDPAHDFGIDVVRRDPGTGGETRRRFRWSDVTHGRLATFYLMPDDQVLVGVGATTQPATTRAATAE